MKRKMIKGVKLKIWLIVVLCLSITVDSSAQIKKLSLNEAIEIAVSGNYDAKMARLSVQKADARKDEAIGNALPSLGISANYTNNPIKPKFFLPDFANPGSDELQAVEIGATNSFSTSAQLTQILFNSAVFTGIGTAKIYYDASKEQFKSTISRTITSVKRSFYGVLLAKGLVDVFDTTLSNARRNLISTEALYNEGFIPEFDLIRARTSVQNIEPELLNAKMRYINLLNAFKFNLGMDTRDSVEIIGSINLTEYKTPDIDTLMQRLKSNNFDLRALDLVKQVNEEMITINESEYYPTLSLFGNYTYQGQSNSWDFNTVNSAAIGVNLSLSLFQGFQSENRVQQSKIDYLTSVEQYNQTHESLRMNLRNALERLSVAYEKVNVIEGNVDQARRGYEIAEIRYKEGIGSQMEINDANTALANANLSFLQAAYDYLDATIELEQLLGIVPDKFLNEFDD